jgi:predicted ATP-grasp superfamily ATP-dependent carboligase
LEINPRPSATLDIFEPPGGSLFALHMSACDGALASKAPSLPGAAASAIVYAERDGSIPALQWPDWTADRPHAGATIKAGEPLCTIHAFAAAAAEARQLVDERLATVLVWTHART